MNQSENNTLQQIIDDLSENFYIPLEKASEQVYTQIPEGSGNSLYKDYVNYSKYLCTEVRNFISARKDEDLVYINELSEKDQSSHDCTNCSGKCGLRHSEKVVEMSTSNSRMKSIGAYLTGELQALNKVLDTLTTLRDGSQQLMRLLQNTLEREESSLIPAILKSQKNIHAGA